MSLDDGLAIRIPKPAEPGTTTCLRCEAPFRVGDTVTTAYVVARVESGESIGLNPMLVSHVHCPEAVSR